MSQEKEGSKKGYIAKQVPAVCDEFISTGGHWGTVQDMSQSFYTYKLKEPVYLYSNF